MIPHNPYAPPAADDQPAVPTYMPGGGPIGFRDGDKLVLPNGISLPPVCFKCGSQGPVTFKHKRFAWSPQWTIFIVLISWLLGLIVMLILQKKSEFHIPLCAPCLARWKRATLIAVVTGLSFFVLIFVGVGLGSVVSGDVLGPLILVGFVGWLVALVVTLVMRNKAVIVPRKIDATHTWLAGVHPETIRTLAG